MGVSIAQPPRNVPPSAFRPLSFLLVYVLCSLCHLRLTTSIYVYSCDENCAHFQVVVPKVEPKFQAPFLGFTRTAEIWNSRACMIGLIGTFIVELVNSSSVLVFMVWYCEWRKLRKVLFLADMFFSKICRY